MSDAQNHYQSQAERLRELATGASGLMVSLAIHLVALMLLGMVVYHSTEGLEDRNGMIATWLNCRAGCRHCWLRRCAWALHFG